MPPSIPTKEDLREFLSAWVSLNIAESTGKHAPKPSDEEHAAVRRVVRWIEQQAHP